jgi:acyl-CoA synthetase (AMP-forming)/AMP-acid ligase II
MIDGDMQTFALTVDKIIDHAAKWSPATEVVTARKGQENARIGYAGLRDRARRTSAVLAGLGVGKGDRVATLAWNTQAHVEAWYGVMCMGAVCHTLNPRLTAVQLAWMLDQSGARILIVSADLLKLALEVADQAAGLARIFVIDSDETAGHARVSVEPLEPLVAAASGDAAWGDFDERSPAGLCFTSGSTGAPKGVTYTHRGNFLHTFKMMAADVLGARSVDVVLPIVPLFHASAWGLPFALPAAGAKMVLPGRYTDGASLARLMAEEGVTMAVAVPTVFLGLCDHLDATGMRLPALQRIIVGGAPMPPALMDRIERQLGVAVQTSWGMTELSPVGVFGVVSDPERRAAVAGRPALGVDLMVADEHGAPLPEQREHEGRLKVRGAAVIERYFGQSQPAADANGWFDTGDLARIERNGDLVITGRAKDLIKSGGEWINPAEIEAIVNALPQVALSAVIGRADEKWSERPILLVEMRDGQDVSDDALLGALKGRIASWWVPDAVIRLEAMPLASTGKIDKLSLRAAYGQGQAG